MMERMRTLLVATALLLIACPSSEPNDDDTCMTAISVCAYWAGPEDPVEGSALVREVPDGAELEAILGTDGCVTIAVGEGSWEWRASDMGGSCVSSLEAVSVDECSIESRSVDLAPFCLDGR